ncbi:hypothetical protein SAMN05216559_1900 [Halomicrobium zhouii]|uniref:Uncharacterized protein n=1 Tax=Halomicrobium zhouii TaxID=767519 RepID=A0A1I6L2N5_9EURY|nr:hypothetical protein SAMN05216559_1900 [Halomicrobium zhouii]
MPGQSQTEGPSDASDTDGRSDADVRLARSKPRYSVEESRSASADWNRVSPGFWNEIWGLTVSGAIGETGETGEPPKIVPFRLVEGQLAEARPLADLPRCDSESTRPVPAVRPR